MWMRNPNKIVAKDYSLHINFEILGCTLGFQNFNVDVKSNKIVVRNYSLHVNFEIQGCALGFQNFNVDVKSQQNNC